MEQTKKSERNVIDLDNHEKLVQLLKKENACNEAMKWVIKSNYDFHSAWNMCERGDWMIWLAGLLGIDKRKIVLAVVACVREGLQCLSLADKSAPMICLNAVEAWSTGKGTLQAVITARKTTWASARGGGVYSRIVDATANVAATAEAAAADSVINPADVTEAIEAAADVAYATDVSGFAAVNYTSAVTDTFRKQANLVRKHIPWKVIEEQIKRKKEKENESG